MPTIQTQIKGIHNGNLALEIPLRMLRRVLNLQSAKKAKQEKDVWDKACGILKDSKIDAVRYQRRLRNEWS